MWILCNNYGEKLVYLKPHDSVKGPIVSQYGLKNLLRIFWNYSGALKNKLLETSLMVTPYIYGFELTEIANKCCSHYDKPSGSMKWISESADVQKNT